MRSDINDKDREIIQILEQISKDRLVVLLYHPAFKEEVLRVATLSPKVKQRVDEIVGEIQRAK